MCISSDSDGGGGSSSTSSNKEGQTEATSLQQRRAGSRVILLDATSVRRSQLSGPKVTATNSIYGAFAACDSNNKHSTGITATPPAAVAAATVVTTAHVYNNDAYARDLPVLVHVTGEGWVHAKNENTRMSGIFHTVESLPRACQGR